MYFYITDGNHLSRMLVAYESAGSPFESCQTHNVIQKISGLPIFLNLPSVRDNLLFSS